MSRVRIDVAWKEGVERQTCALALENGGELIVTGKLALAPGANFFEIQERRQGIPEYAWRARLVISEEVGDGRPFDVWPIGQETDRVLITYGSQWTVGLLDDERRLVNVKTLA